MDVYGTQITIVTGLYKPTYNQGGPHCIYIYTYIVWLCMLHILTKLYVHSLVLYSYSLVIYIYIYSFDFYLKMENHETFLFQWPCSIAMLIFQKVYLVYATMINNEV